MGKVRVEIKLGLLFGICGHRKKAQDVEGGQAARLLFKGYYHGRNYVATKFITKNPFSYWMCM